MYLDGLLKNLDTVQEDCKETQHNTKKKQKKNKKIIYMWKKYISSYFPCEILSISNVYLGDNRLLNLVITL